MDDLDDLETIEEIEEVEAVFGLERVFRDRTNPFDVYNDAAFLDSYRLTKGVYIFGAPSQRPIRTN